jgi:hypothetical protein
MEDAEAVKHHGFNRFSHHGTRKLLRLAYEKGERFNHCIDGEPTSFELLGDTIKRSAGAARSTARSLSRGAKAMPPIPNGRITPFQNSSGCSTP